MLRGNWLLFTGLAVVGAMTVSIGWFSFPSTPNLNEYGEASPINSEYRPGGSKCEPKALAAISDKVDRLSKADACAKETEEYRQQTADLIQQTRAADAAKAQAHIGSQQLWTGWLQTLGGFLTLAAAVSAALYARSAAKAAENSYALEKDLARPRLEVSVAILNVIFDPDPVPPCNAPAVISVANRGGTQVSEFKIDKADLKIDGRINLCNLHVGHHLTENIQPHNAVAPHGGGTQIGLWGLSLSDADAGWRGSDVSISFEGAFRDAFGIDYSWEAITTGKLEVHPYGTTDGFVIGAILNAVEVTVKS